MYFFFFFQIPKSSTQEDIATPLEDEATSKHENIMTQPHQDDTATQEDIMTQPTQARTVLPQTHTSPQGNPKPQQPKVTIEPENPSHHSLTSLSSDSLDAFDGSMEAADSLTSVVSEKDKSDSVTPVVEQIEQSHAMGEASNPSQSESFVMNPLPNVSNLMQSCSSKQKLPSPDLLMDGIHEKITRESVHEVQKVPEKSNSQGISDLVNMCDNKTPTRDLQNYNKLQSKYLRDQESSAQELVNKSDLTLSSNPLKLNPHNPTSNPHGLKSNEIVTDPKGIPQIQQEITTYPLGVISNPHGLGLNPANPDNISPKSGSTPSPVELHGLPKPMDNVDDLNNPPPPNENTQAPLVSQISMDVEGNIGVEFVSHASNGEEESMDVDQEEFELPVPEGESIMTMSVHSLTGRFIEVVSVPPQAEELPLPPSPDPLEDLLAGLEEEIEEKEEEKEETPRKKARQSTPSKKKRPDSGRDGRERTPVESKRKPSPSQRRSSTKEEDIKQAKAEVQRKKSLAKVQSRIGETFRKGVVKSQSNDKDNDDLNSSASSTASTVKRSSVSSLQRKSLAHPSATSTPIIRKPVTPKDAPKQRQRSASSKTKTGQDLGSSDKLNGSSDSVAEKKVLKRNPPKSKWSNITSQIDSGKNAKPKEVKTRILPKTPTKQPVVKVTPATSKTTSSTSSSNPTTGSKPNSLRKSLVSKPSTSSTVTSSTSSSTSSSPTPVPKTNASAKRVTGRSLTTPNVSSAARRISAPAMVNGNMSRNSSLSSVGATRGSGVSSRGSPSPDTGVSGRKSGPDGGMVNGVRPRPSSASTSRTRKPATELPSNCTQLFRSYFEVQEIGKYFSLCPDIHYIGCYFV